MDDRGLDVSGGPVVEFLAWIISAGFIVVSIPTMIIFISCQKIILRGIIIPSMK